MTEEQPPIESNEEENFPAADPQPTWNYDGPPPIAAAAGPAMKEAMAEDTEAETDNAAPVFVDAADETDYRVALDVFAGPMDLLLHLVKKSEVDIWEIPLGDIADQYLDYVRMMQTINIEVAGEFLVMAASLMEIKSRMLLPRPEVDDDGEVIDPRSELIHQLLEYKRFKEASQALEVMEEEAGKRFHRLADDTVNEEKNPDADDAIRDLTLWDLMAAFKKIVSDLQFLEAAGHIIKSDFPVRHYMDQILGRLQERPIANFSDFFRNRRDRGEVIGVFLAILELVKIRSIRAEQTSDTDDIRLVLITSEPADDFVTEFDLVAAPAQEPAPEPDQEFPTDHLEE